MAPAATDPVPQSSQSSGRRRLTLVPTSADARSVAVLKGATAKPITYSLTPDGYQRGITQGTVNDPRFSLPQVLQRPGNVTETLEVKYVESTAPGSADVLLQPGSEWQINERRGMANSEDYATDQVVDIITIVAGVKRPEAPTEDGVDLISQTLYITAVTQSRVKLVA